MKPTFTLKIIPDIEKLMGEVKTVKKTPVTIITGSIGSGKSSLLKRILKENVDGKQICIIQNELDPIGVEEKLLSLKKDENEHVFRELISGCMCCTAKQKLVEKLNEINTNCIGENKVDHIIIETTGLADSMPLLQNLLSNEDLMKWAKIDSCIAICDALQIATRIEAKFDKVFTDDTI